MRSSLSNWSGPSGRRRRSSTPSTIARRRKPTPDRFSRHYADTAALARHPAATDALQNHDLRDRVVEWKGRFFGSGWARYDLARPGTFRLVPPRERLPGSGAITRRCGTSILSEPPSFDEVLFVLAELEQRINKRSGV